MMLKESNLFAVRAKNIDPKNNFVFPLLYTEPRGRAFILGAPTEHGGSHHRVLGLLSRAQRGCATGTKARQPRPTGVRARLLRPQPLLHRHHGQPRVGPRGFHNEAGYYIPYCGQEREGLRAGDASAVAARCGYSTLFFLTLLFVAINVNLVILRNLNK